MKSFIVLVALLFPWTAFAQEAPSQPSAPECQNTDTQVCVDKEDLKKFVQLAQERKCLDTAPPEFKLDSVTIVVDQDNRVFYTGNGPESPYTLEMSWCQYQVKAQGKISVVAALKEPPVGGFRFRPKAYLGYAPITPFFAGNNAASGVDAGLMLDFLYYRWINFDVAVGFSTLGLGAGVDLTRNFGVYLGYGLSWKAILDPRQQPLHNIVLGIDFAF